MQREWVLLPRAVPKPGEQLGNFSVLLWSCLEAGSSPLPAVDVLQQDLQGSSLELVQLQRLELLIVKSWLTSRQDA